MFSVFPARPRSTRSTRSPHIAVEKRKCFYVSNENEIFGAEPDRLLFKTEPEFKEYVQNLNHVTPFYLALEFFRLSPADFLPGTDLDIKCSKIKICKLLGIGRCSYENFHKL